MEHEETSDAIFEKFNWKIENFSRLTKEVYYEYFVLCGFPWRIGLFPRGNKVDNYLSIYLEAAKTDNMSKGWSRDVEFNLVVFNQVDTNMTITKEFDHEFTAKESDWGRKNFMALTEFCDPKGGFIVKDACIVGVEVFVRNSTHEKQVNQEVNITTSLPFESQSGNMEVEVPVPKTEGGRGQNLETPSPVSIEPTKDADAELVSAALGRVLYFLKTRKVKDMNEQACKELQVLWDELAKFKFDLSWLEPHVKSSLEMKSFVEKAMQVENLKQNVVALKFETERLEAKLVTSEVNLNMERDLLKAKGFKEIGLDSELGCGSWKS